MNETYNNYCDYITHIHNAQLRHMIEDTTWQLHLTATTTRLMEIELDRRHRGESS